MRKFGKKTRPLGESRGQHPGHFQAPQHPLSDVARMPRWMTQACTR